MENEPTKANSKVAPIIIPWVISPITSPAKVQVTRGLDNIDEPKKYSPLANIAIKAKIIAVITILILYSF